jgi:hypothetical protein
LLQAHQRLAEAEAERDRLQQRVAQMEDERALPQQQSLWNRLRGK